MNIKAFSGSLKKNQTVMIFLCSDLKPFDHHSLEAKKLKGAIKLAKEEGFSGEKHSLRTVNPPKSYPTSHLILIGLGERGKLTSKTYREAVGMAMRKLHYPMSRLVIAPPSPEALGEPSVERVAQVTAEGLALGGHLFDKYLNKEQMKEKRKNKPQKFELYEKPKKKVNEGIKRGLLWAKGTILARDLVTEAASVVTPEYLGEVAGDIAKGSPQIKVKVWDEKKLQKEGFGGIYGVGRGSDHQPRFIRLEYKPKGKKKNLKKVVLIGKGVTFDTGGVNIKPTAGIETMKQDMGGGAAVLGAFAAIGELQPNLHVVGLVPTAENMVSGYSYKPGDILTNYGGKTIEVINTDAEGRIILSDAFSYCIQHEKPDEIIDMATLTGAVVLALGAQLGGLFCNRADFRDRLLESGIKAGEEVWELPLHEGYAGDLNSEFADIKNAPKTRYGGPIHGALFLKFFLEDNDIPWAHFDIAAVAWRGDTSGIYSAGGTGFTVRTLLEYMSSH